MGFFVALLLGLSVLWPGVSFAQLSGGTFEMRRSQFTGGGGTSSGGTFVMFGTAGQHDAGDLTGGTFLVRGGFIQPGAGATPCPGGTDAECNDGDVCTFDECVAGVCDSQAAKYGDLDGNGVLNIFDLFCLLDGFGNDFSTCELFQVDITGGSGDCTPNGLVTVFDLFMLLDALNGIDPCCGGLPAPVMEESVRALAAVDVRREPVDLTLVTGRRAIRPGGTVSVDLFASGPVTLRGYQFDVKVSGGKRGSLEIESIDIDVSRQDFALSGAETVESVDLVGGRAMAAARFGSVAQRGQVYLGTVELRASADAFGAFRIDMGEGDVILADDRSEVIPISRDAAAVVSVR